MEDKFPNSFPSSSNSRYLHPMFTSINLIPIRKIYFNIFFQNTVFLRIPVNNNNNNNKCLLLHLRIKNLNMKKLFLLSLFCVLFSNLTFSQNFSDILKLASTYNKTFDFFEKTMNIKMFDNQIKFGLESRMYKYKAFNMLIESNNEENKISKISILTVRGGNNEELWYNVTKEANSAKDFKFVQSFISSKNDDVYKNDINFNTMVEILRKSKSDEDYIYFIVFNKENLYYHFNMADKTFYIVIDDQQINRN